jgi:hypothetical protein
LSNAGENATSKNSLSDLINNIVQTRIDANRRYIDEVLEKMQDQNRNYFLAKFAEEMKAMQEAEKAGNMQMVRQHEVMAETYKSIVVRCFSAG